MGFAEKPSNYEFLKALRKSKTASLKPCQYLKETTKLRYYQVVGCLHLLCLSRMVLGDSAGLGKTLQLIAAYAFYLQKDPTLKLLIVCPKSAQNQWAEEFEKFSTGISVHVLTNTYGYSASKKLYAPTEQLRLKGIPFKTLRGFEARKAQYDTVKTNVLIVTYYAVMEDYHFLVENRLPNFVFCIDEIQEIKNQKTKTHFGANEIAQKSAKVYGLSATLIKNRLEEAYQIYNVVVPGLFGGRNRFLQEFTVRKKMEIWRNGRKQRFQKIVGYQNLAKFKETIDPFFLIRRTREVADELPKLISKRIELEMSDVQQKLYQDALSGEMYRKIAQRRYFEFKEKFEKFSDPTDKDYENLETYQQRYEESLTKDGLLKNKLAALSYCQLVSNGPAWIREEGESSKEQEFERLFDQELSAEKVIVFTRFKSGIPRLEAIMDKLELKHTKITGDNDSTDRDKARLSFQDAGQDVNAIFITYAGSAALNLQSANVILFYDTPWSYGDLYQTIGRAQRIGSLYEHVYLMHMINRGSIDEHVIKILEQKKSLINEVMGDVAEGAIEFKNDQLLFKDDEGSIDALFSSVFGKAA